MKQYIVAVKDSAVDAFMRPFTVPHRQAAVRSFTDEVNRAESEMHRHPDDYELYCVGEFDEQTGVVKANGGVELLVRGKDVIRKSNGGA